MDNSMITQRTTYQESFVNKKWRKRNYQHANFLNVNRYRQQDALAVFSVGLTPQPQVSQSFQAVHPVIVQADDNDELIQECEMLRAQLREYQSKPREDKSRVTQLESEISNLKIQLEAEREKNNIRNSEIEDLRYRLSQQELRYQAEINQLKQNLNESEVKIPINIQQKVVFITNEFENLRKLLFQKDNEIEEWRLRCQDLESNSQTEVISQVTYLTNEVEVWKQRFIQLNKEYHENQEKLIMLQAERDAIAKQGQAVRTVTVQEVRKSGVVRSTVVDPTTKTSDIIKKVQGGI